MTDSISSRIFCPRCKRIIVLGKDCPYCGLWASLIKFVHTHKDFRVLPPELHRDTVRRGLTNLVVNTTEDPDGTVEKIAEILADGIFLNLEEANNLVKEIYNETRQQIIDETWYLDGSHPDVEEAGEMCFTSEIDTFVNNILQGLEKKGKLFFQDTGIIRHIGIEPSKPLSTFREIKQLFGKFSGFLWWIDKHFSIDGFWHLPDLDKNKIKEVKILTGPAHLDNRFKEVCKLTKKEFEKFGVSLQIKVVVKKEKYNKMHDRYLICEAGAYLTPPVNLLTRKIGDIQKLDAGAEQRIKKIFDDFWGDAIDLIKRWNEVKEAKNRFRF